ncbi:MAG: ATP-binding cassette domain-containing protein [Peptococcaceae bacterium]|nr:ATP-binding cassette domain-containing protein [Peptococcaceae bacterium]
MSEIFVPTGLVPTGLVPTGPYPPTDSYPPTESYISFRNVVREYRNGDISVRAADGITFDLAQGLFSVIVGPSGAGKTTVLNILGGMDCVTQGEITVDGRDITRLNKRRRCAYRRDDVGFVFQFYNLIQNLTALENVELASYICANALDAKEVLRDVGLANRMNNFPTQLSGGEQQRVAIARALAKNPKMLLCDEPTGALDYETGKGILKLLQDTCREKGVTVVVITHNSAITPMADRVVKIKSGKVESVKDNPQPLPVSEIEW